MLTEFYFGRLHTLCESNFLRRHPFSPGNIHPVLLAPVSSLHLHSCTLSTFKAALIHILFTAYPPAFQNP